MGNKKLATEFYAGMQAITLMRKEIRDIVTEIGNSLSLVWFIARGQATDSEFVVYVGDGWSVELTIGKHVVIRCQNIVLFYSSTGYREPPLEQVSRIRQELDDLFVPGMLQWQSHCSKQAEIYFAAAKMRAST